METIDRFFQPPNQSFFLFGPRGTGKSTLVKRTFEQALYLDLLDPEVFRIYYSNIPVFHRSSYQSCFGLRNSL